jgi:hypothetical protein
MLTGPSSRPEVAFGAAAGAAGTSSLRLSLPVPADAHSESSLLGRRTASVRCRGSTLPSLRVGRAACLLDLKNTNAKSNSLSCPNRAGSAVIDSEDARYRPTADRASRPDEPRRILGA